MLDFLIENWLILLLFIGIFSSMFGSDRRKKSVPPPVRPAPTPVNIPWEPTMEETKDHVPQMKNEEKEMGESIFILKENRTMTEDNVSESEEKKHRTTQEGERTSKEFNLTRSEAEIGEAPVLNKQEVVRGLIWSQILEKPRGRNPHPGYRPRK
ncbi:hypothetical protein L1765_02320 [Microaerobacter geothermalis]|uniref:hypothetical protein n=1 Tax=Microaerobacter geothermalis TaxID=674972 RepID=UPI001F2B9F4A|nr:hypothetical protein [Microaerobacter geothermalis]MCF6092831.1 hypothetical protein [Microaerobacter geothermalis]